MSLACLTVIAAGAARAELASPWVDGHQNRIRLSAGEISGQPFAFIEIEMGRGWKTYWRNPGDAGGIPPSIDVARSGNLARAEVLMPVPSLLSDRAGDVIGYKEHVVFPVRLVPADAGQPMTVAATVSIGICETLCVPVDAELTLDIPSGALPPPTADARAAFDAVPRAASDRRPDDPSDVSITKTGEATALQLEIAAVFPGDDAVAAVFLDAPGGLYVPIPKRSGNDAKGRARFVADLSRDVDLQALKASELRVTLKGEKGQSEVPFKID